jgi:hypothetical protein
MSSQRRDPIELPSDLGLTVESVNRRAQEQLFAFHVIADNWQGEREADSADTVAVDGAIALSPSDLLKSLNVDGTIVRAVRAPDGRVVHLKQP